MDSSGDHLMFTGWPCLQLDINGNIEPEAVATTSTLLENNFPLYDTRNIENNSTVWPDFNYDSESLATDNIRPIGEYYTDCGDYFGDLEDRKLDDISNMAVVDTNENSLRSYCDFPDDIHLDTYDNMAIAQPTLSFNDIKKDDSWYLDPYGDDFTNDINFMEDFWRPDRPLLRWAIADGWNQHLEDLWLGSLKVRKLYRNKNIDILFTEEEMTPEELQDHETMLLILTTIKAPGRANEGLRLLHECHLCRPQINLRPYIEEFDFYLKRYIAWGLNYYDNINKMKKNANGLPSDTMAASSSKIMLHNEPIHEEKMKKLSIRMLQCCHPADEVIQVYWDLLLDWFTDAYDTNMKRYEEANE